MGGGGVNGKLNETNWVHARKICVYFGKEENKWGGGGGAKGKNELQPKKITPRG
jgi:hypothetical protein